MKKQLLTVAAVAILGMGSAYAQRTVAGKAASTGTPMQVKERCSTPVPDAGWDAAFNKLVDEFNAQQAAAKLANPNLPTVTNYTIPVVVHVIHGGQAVGTFPNISQAQVNSQITVLNNDYAGTGLNVGNYPATAFATYATNGSLPAANKDASGRVKIANTGISFCMALIDKNGNTMTEPGIDRVNYTTGGWANPTSFTTATTFQNYINGTVKPATVWDPTKYLNMWVTDENNAVGLLGYATFPAASTLTGIPGGSTGTATTDGFWAWAKAFGNVGTLSAPYNKGRTCTHEIGHWLGLRHIWGDNGNCGATDYCVDTPPQQGSAGPPAGCYYGTPTYPAAANACTRPDGVAGANITNVNGDMFMNFMDYTDDIAMYMFTVDQTTRIQTAMANGTYRKFLGTHGLCSSTPQPPVANFTFPSNICMGTATAFTDASANLPTSWAWSVSPSAGVTITTATMQNPSINFTTAGAYTVSLTATNAQGNNSVSLPVTVNNCTPPPTTCPDTLSPMDVTDSLTVLRSGNGGFVVGTNGYDDREKAQYYSSTGLTTYQVTGGIALFFRNGTSGTTGSGNVSIKMYSGDNVTGPSGAALKTHTTPISAITSLTPVMNVPYCGDPNLGFASAIIYPYSFNFTTPQNITGDFLMSLVLPVNGTDTAVVFHTSGTTEANPTAWELWSAAGGGTWNSFNDGTANTWQSNATLAILPKIGCVTGINDVNSIGNNIALFPNPSSGNVNFVTTLPKATDLTFTVTNMIGQVVYQKTEKNVTSNIIGIDLTGKEKGVYMVSITGSNGEKVVKRIVIN